MNLQVLLKKPTFWICLSVLSCVFSLFHYSRLSQNFEQRKQSALLLQKRLLRKNKEIALSKELELQLQKAHPDYVEDTLESFIFLSEEIVELETLLGSSKEDSSYRSRLSFLQNGENQLLFKEDNFHRASPFQEVDLYQEHPVEMNEKDLKRFLSIIERVSIDDYDIDLHSPSFQIQHFSLVKKPLLTEGETFLITTQLIKREVTP